MRYRKSAEDIEIKTKSSISHQTIKNKLDFIGEKQKQIENERCESYLKGEIEGKKSGSDF